MVSFRRRSSRPCGLPTAVRDAVDSRHEPPRAGFNDAEVQTVMKRWLDEFFAALHVLREQLWEEVNWRQRSASEREAITRNLLLYWLLAPCLLLILIWLIASLSKP